MCIEMCIYILSVYINGLSEIYGLVHPRKNNSPCMVVNVVHHCSPPFHQHLDKLHGMYHDERNRPNSTDIAFGKKEHFVGWYDVLSLGKISENSGARYISFSSNLPPSSRIGSDPRLVHPKLPGPRCRQIEGYIDKGSL